MEWSGRSGDYVTRTREMGDGSSEVLKEGRKNARHGREEGKILTARKLVWAIILSG